VGPSNQVIAKQLNNFKFGGWPAEIRSYSLAFAGIRKLPLFGMQSYNYPNFRMTATRHTGRLPSRKSASFLQFNAQMKRPGVRAN
jgi:hypothetical protein